MYRVLGALVAGRDRESSTSSEEAAQLLASACRALSSASPDCIRSTHVSVAASSVEQAEALVEAAHKLAAAHSLIAAVDLGDGRFRVRFLRLHETAGSLNGGQ